MAANTAANVLVGATGHVYTAPVGTALPTTELAALNAAFVNVGYISEDGVVQSVGRDTSPVKAWGGDEVRRVRTSHALSYALTMLETNAQSLELYYGDQTTPATAVEIKASDLLRQVFVIDVVDGTNLVRIVIPDGEVVETGDVTYATEEAIQYPITLACYADSAGVKAYKYVHDASAS